MGAVVFRRVPSTRPRRCVCDSPSVSIACRPTCSWRSPSGSPPNGRRREDVVSFAIGDPDLPTPQRILDRLWSAAQDPANHRYPESEGLPELRKAIADWYQRRFGVGLDPDTEVLPLIGAKEGHRPYGALLHRPWRRRPRPRPGLPRLLHRDDVRGRRVPLDAAAGRERLSARPRRHSRGGGAQGQGPLDQLSEQPHGRGRRARLLPEGGRLRGEARHRRLPRRNRIRRSPSTATGQRASSRPRGPWTWASSSTPCPSPTT